MDFILELISYVTIMVFIYFTPYNHIGKMFQNCVNAFGSKPKLKHMSGTLCNRGISYSLKHPNFYVIRITININPALVPCSGIFLWGYFTFLHMLWNWIYSDQHHSRFACNVWRLYMHTWIWLETNELKYRQRIIINQHFHIKNLIGNNVCMDMLGA